MAQGKLIFKPWLVQTGAPPHLDPFVYATDENGDTFRSDIRLTGEGIEISDNKGRNAFGITVRWKVDGYGYLFMTLDNGGAFYHLPPSGIQTLNLNLELAKNRAAHNQRRHDKFVQDGWKPSRELTAYMDLARSYLDDAVKQQSDGESCGRYSQESLRFGLLASDLLEIEKARFDNGSRGVIKVGRRASSTYSDSVRNEQVPALERGNPNGVERLRPPFLMGCDGRGFFQMDENLFLERFTELFNYATITHYLIGDVFNFEQEEGQKRFAERERLLAALRQRNIMVEGRPLLWLHKWVTPGWLTAKSYSEVKKYLEKHVRQVVGHYGDEIQVWEVVNELHDWANELELDHDQTIELTRLACDVARDTNPKIRLLINNCCPFAQYVQMGKWCDKEAKYPQRTPHQFVQQLIEAGVDFDIAGVQMYFTKQLFADCVAMMERYESMGKTVHLTEVGCPSAGLTLEFADKEEVHWSSQSCEWRRHWDEDLQADWLEAVFTVAYSKPWIEAANWYDFVDPYGYLKSGGLLRSPQGEKKAAYNRFLELKQQWHVK